jgi:ribose transport system permease protein
MLIVMIMGGIDLCIGSTAGMAACLATKTLIDSGMTTQGLILGLVFALGFCILFGLAQGASIAYFGLPPFVVTYATMYAVYGLAIVYTNNSFQQPGTTGFFYQISNYQIFGIPMIIYLFVFFCIITGVLLGCTSFGRKAYAVGGNRKAAQLVGINTKLYSTLSYVLCSFFVGIGGIMLASLNTNAYSETARGYHGKVLTALVVGGIAIEGGEGNIGGALFGAIFIGILNNALILLDVPADYQNFVSGVIIIAAIALNSYSKRRSSSALIRGSLPDKMKFDPATKV